MKSATTLTDTQGQALITTHQAVRLGDNLMTRTAAYRWNDAESLYVRTHTGLKIAHTSQPWPNKKGYQWNTKEKCFQACACSKCL